MLETSLKPPNNWNSRILTLSWPVVLSNLSIPLVGLADVAVMGQLSDPSYIGSITIGAAIFSAIYWLFGFLRMGTTGLVAQSFGASKWDEITRTYLRALIIASILGLVLILAQVPIEFALFSLFKTTGSVDTMARDYFSIRIFSAPAVLISLASIGVLFGLQKMKTTLFLTIFLNATNLTLDVVLVLVFDLGAKGVAIGTLVSEWLSAALGVFLVVFQIRNKHEWRKSNSVGLFRGQEFARLFDVSGNLILRTFLVQIPFFVGTLLATGLGENLLAAHGILMQLYFLMTYGLDGFAHTAESLAGYYFGAKSRKEFRDSCYYSCLWTIALAFTIAATYFLFSTEFVAFMTNSQIVRATANQFTIWIAIAPILCAGAFTLDGIFIGITHIKQMRDSMFFAGLVWAVTILSTYSLLGYHAIWLAMSTFMLSRTLLLAYFLRRIFKIPNFGFT